MSDRVIRDEIWESDRFLDLPSDAARVAFFRFISMADDFGNFEGGARRLFRTLHACTQVKKPEEVVQILDALMLCDLIRRYEYEGREIFHIPRFRPHRQYMVRKMPCSPWDEQRELGKRQRLSKRGLAKEQSLKEENSSDVVATSHPCSSDVAQGVDVGVGTGTVVGVGTEVGTGEKQTTVTEPPAVDVNPQHHVNLGSDRAEKTVRGQGNRGTRLPDDWVLPKTWGEWALIEKPGWTEADVRKTAEAFSDHWHANGNHSSARKLDWQATWRNWVRRSRDSPTQRGNGGGTRDIAAINRAAIDAALGYGDNGSVFDGIAERVRT